MLGTEKDFTFNLRARLFEAILRQDFSFFLLNDAGELNGRLDTTYHVADQLTNGICEMFWCTAQILAMAAFVYSIYPAYLSVVLCFGFGGGVVLMFLIQMNYHGDKCRCRKSDKIARHAREKARNEVRNIKTVREYAREEASKSEFSQRLVSGGYAQLQRQLVDFAMWPIFASFIVAGEQIGNYLAAGRLSEGALQVAQFVMLADGLGHISWITRHMLLKIPEIAGIGEPLGRIFTVMESVSNIEPMPGDAPKPKISEQRFTGNYDEAGEPLFEDLAKGERPVLDITFENVNFAYPGTPEKTIIDSLAIRVVGGKSTAFVGESGCGKTTTVQLVKRSFDPDSGNIFVNGLPLSTWDVRDYRSLMATVAQVQPPLLPLCVCVLCVFS